MQRVAIIKRARESHAAPRNRVLVSCTILPNHRHYINKAFLPANALSLSTRLLQTGKDIADKSADVASKLESAATKFGEAADGKGAAASAATPAQAVVKGLEIGKDAAVNAVVEESQSRLQQTFSGLLQSFFGGPSAAISAMTTSGKD